MACSDLPPHPWSSVPCSRPRRKPVGQNSLNAVRWAKARDTALIGLPDIACAPCPRGARVEVTRARGVRRARLCAPFCNGPRRVNPSSRHPLAGHSLLYGVGATAATRWGPVRDRPTNLRRVVKMPLGAQRSDLIHRPGEGLRFRKAGVASRPEKASSSPFRSPLRRRRD